MPGSIGGGTSTRQPAGTIGSLVNIARLAKEHPVATFSPLQRKAIIGDVAVLVAVTVAGFVTHMTLGAFGRMVVTVGGALAAWFAVAPHVGVYRAEHILAPRSLWRVGLAWLLAAPFATYLRGAILGRDIPPEFVTVVILINGFALTFWRLALGWSQTRRYRAESMSTSNPL